MIDTVTLRVNVQGRAAVFAARLVCADDDAARAWSSRGDAPACALLAGHPAYVVAFDALDAHTAEVVAQLAGRTALFTVPGRTPLRRRVAKVDVAPRSVVPVAAVNLTERVDGATPLWLRPDGHFSLRDDVSPEGADAGEALVAAARWISARRTTTFERLFTDDAFHPERPTRHERLSAAQAEGMLRQVETALSHASVGSDEARRSPVDAAQVRSAALTVLVHLAATGPKLPDLAEAATQAARRVFTFIDAEQGDATAYASLRAHAVLSLARRGAALTSGDLGRTKRLLKGLLRVSPPYGQLRGAWRFAMCSDVEFHEPGCRILEAAGFKPVTVSPPAITAPVGVYRVYEAPFRTPDRRSIQVWARASTPADESHEMSVEGFAGVLIHRHAQLGLFDLRAGLTPVQQRGYKLLMTSQCAGLTTRFVLTRQFPDADIYSSWDSTQYRTTRGVVSQSEGVDCFVATLKAMSRGGTHEEISRAIRRAQWDHRQTPLPEFVQFVGPSHPLLVARFSDIDRDGRVDAYDGFVDLKLRDIAEDVRASATPRDPGCPPSAIAGDAAQGLTWAAHSMDRVALYSDLWARMEGDSEATYAFEAAGFYSATEPPADIDGLQKFEVAGRLPALCRVLREGASLRVEVMFHAQLAHAGREYKRLMVAAEAMTRLFDLDLLGREAPMNTPEGRRAALLLTLAGLLEFPADQNHLDALWSAALTALNLPALSRSLVRGCITDADHAASNYYGSARGVRQLLAALASADPVAWDAMQRRDPKVGRAALLPL